MKRARQNPKELKEMDELGFGEAEGEEAISLGSKINKGCDS